MSTVIRLPDLDWTDKDMVAFAAEAIVLAAYSMKLGIEVETLHLQCQCPIPASIRVRDYDRELIEREAEFLHKLRDVSMHPMIYAVAVLATIGSRET